MDNINIAEQFSETPGGRFKKDGEYSGEEFRKVHLDPFFADPNDDRKIRIILDGVMGFPISFLEEAFGGLARKFGIKRCLGKISFVSNEDPLLIDKIQRYIEKSGGE